jgi:hypothetical protein
MAKAKTRAWKQGTKEGDRSMLTCRLAAEEGSGRFMTPTVSYTSNNPYYTPNDASATARERSSYNPFTITGRDPSPHQEVGSTARPSPEAEESVIGWSEFSRGRQSDNNTRRTDSYRPAYGSTSRGGRYRGRGRATGRRPRGDRGPARSLFDRITPRE